MIRARTLLRTTIPSLKNIFKISDLEIKMLTHLYQVISRITGTERSFEEQVESARSVFGFDQLVVLLAVQ